LQDDRNGLNTAIALPVLHAPLGHGAEKVAESVRMGLNFAPFGMIAEVEGAEMVDRFTNAIAGADQKDSCGFSGSGSGRLRQRSGEANGWRCHIHDDGVSLNEVRVSLRSEVYLLLEMTLLLSTSSSSRS
jgi:hypothetical protein